MSQIKRDDAQPSNSAGTAPRHVHIGQRTSVPKDAVVVGLSHSQQSAAALEWGASEAICRGLPLHLIHAVQAPSWPDPADTTRFDEDPAGCVTDALRALNDSCTGLTVTWSQPYGAALPALTWASRFASLIAIGTRGRGALQDVVLGSVAVELIADAHCPIAVVRTPLSDAQKASGPIVLGLEGHEDDQDALRVAFRQADARRRDLLVVHATDYGFLERVRIERLVSTERRHHPTVSAKVIVKRGSPAELLVARSAHASLLVLGSHGRHEAAGVVLGSVSQAVLRRAACPVLVARAGTLRPFGMVSDVSDTTADGHDQ